MWPRLWLHRPYENFNKNKSRSAKAQSESAHQKSTDKNDAIFLIKNN